MTFVTEWHLSYNANAFSRCSFEYISCSLSEPFKVQLFVRTPLGCWAKAKTQVWTFNDPFLYTLIPKEVLVSEEKEEKATKNWQMKLML